MRKFYLQLYQHTLSAGDENLWVELADLGLHPDLVRQLAELGIVEVRQDRMPVQHLLRLQRLMRLRQNLGVNLPGAAVILDLLERIEQLEDELECLKRNR